MQLVIDTAQTKITVKDSCFYIQNQRTKRQISPKRISSIAITSNVLINAKAMILAVENQVPIYYFDNIGNVKAKVWSPYFTNLSSLRQKQLMLLDSKFALAFSVDNILLKISGQQVVVTDLVNFFNAEDRTLEKFHTQSDQVSGELKELNYRGDTIKPIRHKILGLEGSISSHYWRLIGSLLPEPFAFTRRSRMPSKDCFNAALNYSYGMTYAIVEQGVFAAGLDPNSGFFHTENYKKTSLVFDLIEPFRPMIDKMVLNLVNKELLNQSHFKKKDDGIILNKSGKAVLIPAFNDEMLRRQRFNEKNGRLKDHIYRYVNRLAKRIKESKV